MNSIVGTVQVLREGGPLWNKRLSDFDNPNYLDDVCPGERVLVLGVSDGDLARTSSSVLVLTGSGLVGWVRAKSLEEQ